MGERSQRSERPDWCAGINCPNYLSGRRCALVEWVNEEGYVGNKRRRRYYDEFRKQAETNPQMLVERCNRTVSRI